MRVIRLTEPSANNTMSKVFNETYTLFHPLTLDDGTERKEEGEK